MGKLAWGLKRPEAVWINTNQKMKKLVDLCREVEVIAYDTETTGLDIYADKVVFWSISTGPDRYFLEGERLHQFKEIFDDPSKSWIGSQIKFDFHMSANSGYPVAGNLLDTLVMDRLLDPIQEHGLKEVYEREFGERMRTFAETFYPMDSKGKFRKPPKKTLQEIMLDAWDNDPDRVIDYASLDAWGVFRLFNRLKDLLSDIRTGRGYTLWDLFLVYEVPMSRVLYEMERHGCKLDTDYLGEIKPKLEQELSDIGRKLNKLVGYPINPASTKQLIKLFFENKGLKPTAWTSGGSSGKKSPSLNITVVTELAKEHEEAALVLRHRKISKILGTYITGLIDRADDHGRIHTTFNQHVVDTARLSSRDPNLQNQPRPNKTFDIRKAFVASPRHKLIVCDYDQLEMFILAHYSKDEGMIKNIIAGKDIHTSNVELVWGEPYADVAAAKKNKDDDSDRAWYLRDLRNKVKIIGFGLNYGKAANSLARETGILAKVLEQHPDWPEWKIRAKAKEEAQALVDRYFDRIPGAAKFIKGTYRTVADTKYVETYLGRRRWLRQIVDWDEKLAHMQRELEQSGGRRDLCWCNTCRVSRDGERRSVNTIIQGSAADIVMCAMIKCFNDQRLKDLGIKMLLQIHDELVFECPEKHVEKACPIIQYNMENPGIKLRVPLKAEPGVGDNWVEAK